MLYFHTNDSLYFKNSEHFFYFRYYLIKKIKKPFVCTIIVHILQVSYTQWIYIYILGNPK